MFGILSRRTAVVALLILAGIGGGQTVSAQAPAESGDVATADLQRQMEEMQRELTYLRQRDAQRDAWESSVVEYLPEVGVSTSTVSYRRESLDCGVCDAACGESSCSCCTCGSLGLCSCLCPPKEAPCIECPRVSTLNPYFNVHIFGALKLDMLFSGARPISPGTPFFLLPDSPIGLDQETVDINARQTTLAAAFTGPKIGSFQSGGLLLAMLYNDFVLADQYGFLPLQAYGELRNEKWRFAGGLQFDVFSPGSPTVLPFAVLCASGNAGNSSRGQLRLERFLHPADNVQWTLQGALSEPITTIIDPTFGLSEDNGWPNVEGRIALGLGCIEGAGPAAKRPFEIGVSGVMGQIRTTEPLVRQVVADVWGLGVDFRWKMTDCFGVMGEVFTGQTLGTYNGGVLQNISVDGLPATLDTLEGIRSSGGWFETYLYWTPCLHSHIGYGIDDPIDRDVAATQIVRNETYFGNVIWDINPTLRVAFELTWRETAYRTLLDNEGPGFHTQFQWAF